jgi:hypothetical protein
MKLSVLKAIPTWPHNPKDGTESILKQKYTGELVSESGLLKQVFGEPPVAFVKIASDLMRSLRLSGF